MAGNAVEKNEERRNYRRVSDAVALNIDIIDSGDAANSPDITPADELPNHPTHVVSLSPSGLKCYHTEAFDEGEKVMLTLKLFPEEKTLSILATVANAGEEQNRAKNDRFFAGLAFENVSDDTRDTLLAHIDSVARQSFGGAIKLVNK